MSKTFPAAAGFTLIETLVSISILAMVTMGAATMMSWQSRMGANNSSHSNLLILKQDFIATIANQTAWEQMKIKNPSLSCLNAQSCTPGQGGAFALYDVSGALIYNSLDPKAGYTLSGQRCSDFDPLGNARCPIHVNLSWKASCNAAALGSCKSPGELVSISFQVAAKSLQADQILGLANLNVRDQYRMNLSVNTPVVQCAKAGKIFIGEANSVGTETADSGGCISLTAFRGPQGPPGPQGPTGDKGPVGDQGPPGAPSTVTCVGP